MDGSIFVAGHRGMVGSALVRALKRRGHDRLLTVNRNEVDLTRQVEVEAFFDRERPEIVLLAAAKVGGIYANATYPADFGYENIIIEANVIHSAFRSGARQLLFLGSSCIYPRMAPQPIHEEALLSLPLEATNEAYAIAKIAGLKLCQHYRKQYGVLFHAVMPSNLYGTGDNYQGVNSHVIPALIRRFHEAKVQGASSVTVWGTGEPRREFLHVDDLADGCVHLLGMENPPDWVNLGVGKDMKVRELAELIREVTGFEGSIEFDTTKPDGTPRKLLDTSRMESLGWKPAIEIEEGLRGAYADFLKSLEDGTARLD
jgi:GDP-L-fucose synthase